ncbi:MAG: hypothetical protein AAFQ58_23505 [Pseudomonadota bacterium]
MSSYIEKFQVTVLREQHTDRIVSIRYEDGQGRLHRTGGLPALEVFDPSTKRLVVQHFAEHGAEHRLGGLPSYVENDPDSGRILIERWKERGAARSNGATVIYRDPSTGEVAEAFRQEGEKMIALHVDAGGWLDMDDPSP